MLEITSEVSLFIIIIIFIISLIALLKGADFLLEGAERIGKYFKLPAFVIGALIVGAGTSLPELATSGFAVAEGVTEIVAANIIGSNIANILLVAGFAAIIAGVLHTSRNLLRLELPLLIIATSLFLFVSMDGIIIFWESLIMLFSLFVYIAYLLNTDKYQTKKDREKMLVENKNIEKSKEKVKSIGKKEYLLLASGIFLLAVGAKFLIDSVVVFSEKLDISVAVVSVLAIAVGTSLPEILVSIKAVLKGKTDLAFGNVFGSNLFNILMVTGILGLFANLEVSQEMIHVGLPFLAMTTLIFYISAVSKRIYIWEGLLFLAFYALFVLKVVGY